MWVSGITQGLMWKEFTPDGLLAYPSFVDIVTKLNPFYWGRAFGGFLYLCGLVVMIVNVWRTAKAGSFADEEVTVPDAVPAATCYPATGMRCWNVSLCCWE